MRLFQDKKKKGLDKASFFVLSLVILKKGENMDSPAGDAIARDTA